MPFYDTSSLAEMPLADGVSIKAVYGEKMSVSFLEMQPGSKLPSHRHQNEQISIIISGEVEYQLGQETKICREGSSIVIPPTVPHAITAVSHHAVKLLNMFAPPREISQPLQYVESSSVETL